VFDLETSDFDLETPSFDLEISVLELETPALTSRPRALRLQSLLTSLAINSILTYYNRNVTRLAAAIHSCDICDDNYICHVFLYN